MKIDDRIIKALEGMLNVFEYDGQTQGENNACYEAKEVIKLVKTNCDLPVVVQHGELVCAKHNKKITLEVKVGRCVICGESAIKAN